MFVLDSGKPCPGNWQYKHHPSYSCFVMEMRLSSILRPLRTLSPDQIKQQLQETKTIHARLFTGLTPDGFHYFAGNYRGTENLRCLVDYSVSFAANKGVSPKLVRLAMKMFHDSHSASIEAVRAEMARSGKGNMRTAIYNAAVACGGAMEHFYRIHPYADGNGHTGRVIVWMMMGYLGVWLSKWNMAERPPGFISAIEEYRKGNHDPFAQLIFAAV